MERIARAAADRTARVGVAEALAVEEQVRAYGGPLESLLALALTAKLDDLRSQLETNPEGPRLSAATDP